MESISSRRSSILLGERRTSIFNRIAAKVIDLIVIIAVYFIGTAIWFPLGVVAAAGLAGIFDSLGIGQSVGKRIIGLRVIEDNSGLACSAFLSVLRNGPVVLAILFSSVPVLWAFAWFLTVPIFCLEVYLLFTVDVGVRLGDVMGNTLVVEHFEEVVPTSERNF